MLIIPVQDKVDWRHPPLLVLILVVVNTVIFFITTHQDRVQMEERDALVPIAALAEREAHLIPAYLVEQDGVTAWPLWQLEQMPAEQLFFYVDMDLAFDHYVHQHWQAEPPDPQWQADRQALEDWRDGISWVGLGFKPAAPELSDLIASMFLHADLWHLLGNMLFLLLFGLPLEHHWGSTRLTLIYLLAGVAGTGMHWLTSPDSFIPGIGASGAIAGLMGCYAVTYGFRRTEFFASAGFWFGSFKAPALMMFPVWLGYELIQNSLTDNNVNYMAHAGGLIGGFVLTFLAKVTTGTRTEALQQEAIKEKHEEAAPHEDVRLLMEAMRFDDACALAGRRIKTTPQDDMLWQLYMDNAARVSTTHLDQALKDALALIKEPPFDDRLLDFLLPRYQSLGGDLSRLAPPFRLLEAEYLARQQQTAEALELARSLTEQWQHPRLARLIQQLSG